LHEPLKGGFLEPTQLQDKLDERSVIENPHENKTSCPNLQAMSVLHSCKAVAEISLRKNLESSKASVAPAKLI